MREKQVNVASAKKHFSDLIGRVAYTKESVLITKRGKPVVKIVPLHEKGAHLVQVKGWLDPRDEFFKVIEGIMSRRKKHIPRIVETGR